MDTAVELKYRELVESIRGLVRVVVGFSGGIDSTLVLKASIDALGHENVWAVTGDSESLLPEELEYCRALGKELGIPKSHVVEIRTNELSDPNYRANPIDRCFFCKQELFTKLKSAASDVGASHVLDGTNADDKRDWRPGSKAAGKLGVVSPLAEVGLTKENIREISRQIGLSNWNKPALACLSSRIPYGSEVTVRKLEQIGESERFLRSLGFKQVRVRHHDKIGRIELGKEETIRIYNEHGLAEKIVARLKEVGFTYVTVDIEGYRSGSMNESISKDQIHEQ
jgi:pyridinium-3,5-biscarboxylic acid mononucleotide sulfurtransferase